MEILMLKINEITPYENNPRINKEGVEKVANSIKEFGFKVPLVVDKNNVLVTGHTRYLASKRLGLEEVPVIVANDLTDEQVKAYRLADNKVAEFSKWDEELLMQELSSIANDFNFDVNNFGFDFDVNGAMQDIEDFYGVDDLPEVLGLEREGNRDNSARSCRLKFGRYTVVLTEDEEDFLEATLNDYVEKTGVSYGFINYIKDKMER